MQQALIPFHGSAIPTVERDGEVFVAMKPVAEAIGLDWSAQRRRLNRHPVLKRRMAIMAIRLLDDPRARDHVLLPIAYLNGWLFTITADRANPAIREALVMYQDECFLALDSYWRAGLALNPRRRTISETQSPSDGVAKTRGQRFAEERERFEAREQMTIFDALRGLDVASPASIRSIEQRNTRIKDKLLVALVRMKFDVQYILYGERVLTDGERALRDAYRLTDDRHRALMLAQAEVAPIDVVEMHDAYGEIVGFRGRDGSFLDGDAARLLN